MVSKSAPEEKAVDALLGCRDRKAVKNLKFVDAMSLSAAINSLLQRGELTRHCYPSRAADGRDNSTSGFPRV